MFSSSELLSLHGLRRLSQTQVPLPKGTYNSCRHEVNTANAIGLTGERCSSRYSRSTVITNFPTHAQGFDAGSLKALSAPVARWQQSFRGELMTLSRAPAASHTLGGLLIRLDRDECRWHTRHAAIPPATGECEKGDGTFYVCVFVNSDCFPGLPRV